jgi:hypothetical protein
MRNKQVNWRKLNNEAYLISVDKHNVHLLNNVGGFIWKVLEQTLTVGELVQRVCAEYEVTPEEAQADICSFIDKMRGLDLIDLSRNVQQPKVK